MSDYEKTARYWDEVFEKREAAFDGSQPFAYPEIEAGLRWLCQDPARVVDFGCGDGRALLRCLALGANQSLGLYLWNLSDDALTALLAPRFVVERSVAVEIPEHRARNRLTYVRRAPADDEDQ